MGNQQKEDKSGSSSQSSSSQINSSSYGSGQELDDEEIIARMHALWPAPESGDVEPQECDPALIALEETKLRQSSRELKTLAAQGDKQAQLKYALHCLGCSGRKAKEGIKRLNQMLNNERDPQVLATLAWSYEYGMGVKEDLKEACRLYKEAAGKGHSEAQERMGFFCEKGLGGVRKDINEALQWYNLAAAQGEPGAIFAKERLLPRPPRESMRELQQIMPEKVHAFFGETIESEDDNDAPNAQSPATSPNSYSMIGKRISLEKKHQRIVLENLSDDDASEFPVLTPKPVKDLGNKSKSGIPIITQSQYTKFTGLNYVVSSNFGIVVPDASESNNEETYSLKK